MSIAWYHMILTFDVASNLTSHLLILLGPFPCSLPVNCMHYFGTKQGLMVTDGGSEHDILSGHALLSLLLMAEIRLTSR